MTDQPFQMLRQAVARNLSATLSVPADDAPHTARTRLLAEDGAIVWVDAAPQLEPIMSAACRNNRSVSLAFRMGGYSVDFESPIVGYVARYPIREDVTVPAVGLKWPVEVRLTQRRGGYRVRTVAASGLSIKAWLEASPAIGPTVSRDEPSVRAELCDLSVGGLSMVLRAKRAADAAAVGAMATAQRMRVELTAGGGDALVLSGQVRQPPLVLPDGAVRVGLHFNAMSQSIEGRRTLSQVGKIVAELQRAEARRRAG